MLRKGKEQDQPEHVEEREGARQDSEYVEVREKARETLRTCQGKGRSKDNLHMKRKKKEQGRPSEHGRFPSVAVGHLF